MSRALRRGAELAPGYEVVSHLKRTRVLDVYDVWSEERHAHCVAKTLRPEHEASEHARRALAREGRLLRSLTHPHIVRAYENVTAPRASLILETLPGATLGRLLDDAPRRRLALEDLGWLGLHLCSALAYLHGKRILHLDLKPSNVISDRGIAKLIDLSIARRPGRVLGGIGTEEYMAPEQREGGRVDAATDVWGLGGVLYEVATGERPHPSARVRGRRRMPAAVATSLEASLEPSAAARPTIGDLEDALRTLV